MSTLFPFLICAFLSFYALPAFALSLPTTGNGSAILNIFSTDDSTPFSYSFDFGKLLSELTPASLDTPGNRLTFNLTDLQADLATAAGQAALANGLVFHVSAAAITGSIATAGAFQLLTTAAPNTDAAEITATTSGALAAANAQNNMFLSNLATNPAFTTDPADAFYINANYNEIYNHLLFSAAGSTSEALPFYRLTSNRGSSAPIQAPTKYAGAWSVDLNSSTLTYTAANAVPVPWPLWAEVIFGTSLVWILKRNSAC